MNMNAEPSNGRRPEPFVERHLQVDWGTLHVAHVADATAERGSPWKSVYSINDSGHNWIYSLLSAAAPLRWERHPRGPNEA